MKKIFPTYTVLIYERRTANGHGSTVLRGLYKHEVIKRIKKLMHEKEFRDIRIVRE